MHSFLAMGGYAPFVWPAYGLAVAVMGGLLFATLRGLRIREKELKALQETLPGRRRGAARDGGADGAGGAD